MKQFIIPGVLFLFFSSFNLTAQWVQCSNGINEIGIFSITAKGSNLFAAGRSQDLTYVDGQIYMSTNYGTSWTYLNQNGAKVASDNNYLYFGKSSDNSGGSIYRSSDNGSTWNFIGLPQQCIRSLAVNGNYLFAGSTICSQTNTRATWVSTDFGANWSAKLGGHIAFSFAINGNNVFAGATGVYKSTDSGVTWTLSLPAIIYIYSLAVNGNNVFAGELNNGVYKSTDNGATWTQTSLNNQYVRSLAISGNNIFAGTGQNGVYVSNDNGINWIQRNEGLPNAPIPALFILNNYIYAGTFGYKVYKRSLSEVIGINPISNEVANQYSLSQNYPNPFNPTTKIRFSIPPLEGDRGRMVRLIIYDILGREIAVIVNEQLSPGTYEVEWGASNYPSGVFMYKLVSDDFTETKKMILIK